MARPNVGLVLRSKSVEVVAARTRWGPTRLTKLLTVPIVEGDDAHVVQAIRTALQNAGAAGANVGVSVAAPEILVRSFTMPLLPKTEHETAVRFEVRKYIPFKPDDVVWNFHVTEQRQAKRMHVAFVGIRAQTFAKIQRWLAEAGVAPAFLEAQAVSLARLISPRPKSETGGFTGLVDVDLTANTANIVFVKDQIPYFARDVNLLTDQEGFGTGPQVSDVRLKVLLSELRLSLDFFLREHPNVTVRHMVLFGDPSVLALWVSWLAEQLKCRLSVGTLPLLDQAGQEPLPQFACAVGLAVRFRRPVGITADFVERKPPSEAAPARTGFGLPRISLQPVLEAFTNPAFLRDVARGLLVQGALAAAALGVLYGIGEGRLHHLRASFRHEVQAFPAIGAEVRGLPRASLEQLQRDLQGRAAHLQALLDHRVLMTEKLDTVAKRLPDGVWLDGLTYQYRFDERASGKTTLTLRGSCHLPHASGELDVIARLASDLKRDPRFARGLPIGQLGEIALRDAGPNVTYRTFTFNYVSEPSL